MPEPPESDASLLLFKEILTRLQVLDGKIDAIGNDLVGVENCKSFRLAFQERQNALEKRISKVEYVCAEYGAVKKSYVDEASLMEAKGAVLEKAEEKDGKVLEEISKLNGRLDKIEDTTKILTLSWSAIRQSKGALIALLSFISLLTLVLYGRIYDLMGMVQALGPREVLLVFAVTIAVLCAFIVMIVIWWSKGDKTKIKSILKLGIVLLLLLPIAYCQDEDIITVPEDPYKPVVLPEIDRGAEAIGSSLDILLGIPGPDQPAMNGRDAYQEDMLIQMKVAAFLDDNVTMNNTTLFYA